MILRFLWNMRLFLTQRNHHDEHTFQHRLPRKPQLGCRRQHRPRQPLFCRCELHLLRPATFTGEPTRLPTSGRSAPEAKSNQPVSLNRQPTEFRSHRPASQKSGTPREDSDSVFWQDLLVEAPARLDQATDRPGAIGEMRRLNFHLVGHGNEDIGQRWMFVRIAGQMLTVFHPVGRASGYEQRQILR